MTIGTAEKSVTDLPQIVASLFVLAPFGDLAPGIERINEGEPTPIVKTHIGQN